MSAPDQLLDPARWFAVGGSANRNAHSAGAEAAAEALGHERQAELLVVFASGAYDLDELLAGIGEKSEGVPLIGCSTAGEIATAGPDDASVVVAAMDSRSGQPPRRMPPGDFARPGRKPHRACGGCKGERTPCS